MTAGAGSSKATWSLRVGAAILAATAPLLLSATTAQAAAGAQATPSATAAWTDTKWGPLGQADRDLLIGVRRAGLWEMPAGHMAEEKGGTDVVKSVGKKIATQHNTLDGVVRAEAAKLSFTLPSQPNADQQKWLGEMEQAPEGAEFDKVFVDRLRAAHGKVYSLIASVRAGTRNSLMRDFAETCEGYVKTHMNLLESTGLVDYDGLPVPAGTGSPSAAAGQAAKAQGQNAAADAPLINPASSTSGGLNPMVIWVVLIGAAVAGGLTMLRVLKSR